MSAQTLSIPVPGAQHRLEGRLVESKPGAAVAVVAPPHPLFGGTIGNPVVRAIERALQERGLSTLAFNFRGTGDDTVTDPSGELVDARQDYLAAAGFLSAPLAWLSGYSFGSVAALAAALELGVTRVLMVGPPLGFLDPALLAQYRGKLSVVLGSEDEYAPVPAARELLAGRPDTELTVIDGVDHFFLGAAVPLLFETLTRVLREEIADAS